MLVGLLTESVSAPTTIPERKLHQIAHRAIIDAKKAKDLTPDRIIAEITTASKKYVATPIRRFVLLGSLSFRNSISLPTSRVDSATLTFLPQRPKGFPLVGQGLNRSGFDGGSIV
jgi:hypothetical protein